MEHMQILALVKNSKPSCIIHNFRTSALKSARARGGGGRWYGNDGGQMAGVGKCTSAETRHPPRTSHGRLQRNQHNYSPRSVCEGFQATQMHLIRPKNSLHRGRKSQNDLLKSTPAKSVHVSFPVPGDCGAKYTFLLLWARRRLAVEELQPAPGTNAAPAAPPV